MLDTGRVFVSSALQYKKCTREPHLCPKSNQPEKLPPCTIACCTRTSEATRAGSVAAALASLQSTCSRCRLPLLRPDARRPGECRHQRCAGLVVALAAVHDSSTAKTETLLTAPNPAAALAKARAEFLNRIDRVVTVCERTAGIRVDNLARSWRGSTCKTRPSLRRRQGQYGGRLADADQFVMILEAVCKQ